FNAYVSAHYLESDALYNRQRGYPFNTDDQRGICYQGACGDNNIANGSPFLGLSTAPAVILARPYDATNTTGILDAEGHNRYQLLNPALGCQGLTPNTLTDEEYDEFTTAPRTVCSEDITNRYSQILPKQRRWGIS